MRLVVILAACSSAPAPPPVANHVAPVSVVDPRRCLPVVSDECNCVYSCGVGEPTGDHWLVHHPMWNNTPLAAKVQSWCVDGQCTAAFAIHLDACDGTCLRRAADPTCHFDPAGVCSGHL